MAGRRWLGTWTRHQHQSQATGGAIAEGTELPADRAASLRMAKECALALKLAGQALDPNAPDGNSLALGQLLLREALIGAARVISGNESIQTLQAATAALQHEQPRESTDRKQVDWAEVIETLDANAPPDAVALTRAEVVVTQLVDEARNVRHFSQKVRFSRWVAALLTVFTIALVTISYVALRKPWLDYTWFSSSSWPGYAHFGKLSDRGPYGLLFHTNEEQSPWIVVDLGETRSVKNVRVLNRVDWATNRGLPLKLELAGDDRSFTTIATRTAHFDEWNVPLAHSKAHYLRLQAQGVTILHLREIQIR